jgi:hypothetical protein
MIEIDKNLFVCKTCDILHKCKPSEWTTKKYCSRKCQLKAYANRDKSSKWIGKRFHNLLVIKSICKDSKNNFIVECQCDCGNKKEVKATYLKTGEVKSCGCLRSPHKQEYDFMIRQKINSRIHIHENGCHVWTSRKDKKGYGKIGYRKKYVSVHRLLWGFEKSPLEKSQWLLHTCDNPSCCNLDHLYIGTPKDNVRDMDCRNRRNVKNHRRGEKSNLAKFNEDQVKQILKLHVNGMTGADIARKFSVTKETIYKIINRVSWKHIDRNNL